MTCYQKVRPYQVKRSQDHEQGVKNHEAVLDLSRTIVGVHQQAPTIFAARVAAVFADRIIHHKDDLTLRLPTRPMAY